MKYRDKKLYQKCKQKNLSLKHIAEVGVYLPETSNILYFIKDGIRATLVEANPEMTLKIKDYFKTYPNVKTYHYAVWDYAGMLVFNKALASTFASNLKLSPALANDKYVINDDNQFQVQAITFDTIDDGSIDLLSIDIEGAEWFVLKHLVSKPLVISIETQWKNYTNPYLADIEKWFKEHEYEIWYIHLADAIYYQKGLFKLSWREKLELKRVTLLKSLYNKFINIRQGQKV